MTTYNTLLLDQIAWDLVIDSAGNIALAKPPYSLAQDVASAIKLFLGELWYDSQKGVPYFEEILGQLPPASLFIKRMEAAAMTVPGVVEAEVIISSIENRETHGQVIFIDENKVSNNVNF